MSFDKGSKNRLTEHDRSRFPGQTLFDRLGRAVCDAGCLPRKELFEAWEVARRARRLFRGGRVVDLAGGHGLLAQVMLLLDRSSEAAVVVNPAIPPSATRLHEALVAAWPELTGRVSFLASAIEHFQVLPADVVVSSHACGALANRVLALALGAGAPVAVLPCCHDDDTCDAGPLRGWMDLALAVDAMRATRMEQQGYRVWTQTIPSAITAKNRLLLGMPS